MPWNREYPRPQLRRESFLSLNGIWQLDGRDIRIPFPPRSRLSGYGAPVGDVLNYTHTFTLPEGFAGRDDHIRLHFGAVDQIAEVYVNDRFVARHEGGYLPFFADITHALQPGENILRVQATDILDKTYPYGKQTKKRGGMWYTPVSGIWQSVWLEAVPPNPIECIRIRPDLKGVTLTVVTGCAWCDVSFEGVHIRIETNKPAYIPVPEPRLWSCEDPWLYDLTLETETDRVYSYFALRTVEIRGREILLNGERLFINGVLDQGYFPDGVYLPESPSEYEQDVLRMKNLGFNLLRKHCKVEPEAFYTACDRLGMLVMQDMVNSGPYRFIPDTALPTVGFKCRTDTRRPEHDRRRKDFFTEHALSTQMHLYNHPSLIAYTIFNEGWGQFEADAHYDLLKSTDPSRIYDATSGWFRQRHSDVDSEHVYFRNKRLHGGARPLLLSECGGFGYPVKGHMFNEKARYGYGSASRSPEEFTSKIETMWQRMVLPAVREGLRGVIITQVSDVEDEINGLYTYDRQVCKVILDRMRALPEQVKDLLK